MNGDDVPNSRACVRDMQEGDKLLQFLEVRSKESRKTRSGQDYLDLVLGDATGSISAKVWSDAVRKWGQDFGPGDFVKVEARVEVYKDRPQMVVEKIRKVEPSEVPDVTLLVRCTTLEVDALFAELLSRAGTLKPLGLAQLVEKILEETAQALLICPAARMIHHAYKGGLIEHISTVTRKVEAILPLEPNMNASLAIAGAILHDIGKVRELSPSGRGRTPEGRLIGHVIQGNDLVRAAATEMGLSDAPWLPELEHIILSHHGETEYGAPVKPLTREALLVHFIDNLDSRLKIMEEALEQADPDGFSPYNKWLEGRAFAGTGHSSREDEDD
jgi:3'-5' exoribonuclease